MCVCVCVCVCESVLECVCVCVCVCVFAMFVCVTCDVLMCAIVVCFLCVTCNQVSKKRRHSTLTRDDIQQLKLARMEIADLPPLLPPNSAHASAAPSTQAYQLQSTYHRSKPNTWHTYNTRKHRHRHNQCTQAQHILMHASRARCTKTQHNQNAAHTW